MKGGCEPATGWDDVAARVAVGRRWTSRRTLARAPRSAAGWAESCDAGRTAGSGCGSESVAAAVDGGGAAASAGAAAGVGAGSSVMR